MDKNLIDAAIKKIQNNSEQEYNNIFGVTSDGKELLKEDVENYNSNIGVSQIVIEFAEFLNSNNGNAREIIKKYLEYVEKFKAINMSTDDLLNDTSEQQLDAETIRSSIADAVSRAEEKRASMFVKASDGKWILSTYIDPYEAMLTSVSLAAENDELKRENSRLKATKSEEGPVSVPPQVQPGPAADISSVPQDKSIPLVNPEENEVVVESSMYNRRPGETIQDLPIMDTTTVQTFNAPGMTDEEIRESQDKLADIDPIQAEINARYAEEVHVDESYADDPERQTIIEEGKKFAAEAQDFYPAGDVPDQTDAINDFLNSVNNRGEKEPVVDTEPEPTPVVQEKPQPSGNRKKVVSRRVHSWGTKIKKKIAQLKGILFKENRRGRSVNYLAFCTEIANFRAKYRDNNYETNMDALKNIGYKASASSSLTFDERRRLMGKLSRLEKAVVKLAKKNNEAVGLDVDSLESRGR